MRIGIIDADLLDGGTRHPNLALMKLSGYYKNKGYSVQLLDNYIETRDFDKVHVSKVFSFTDVPEHIIYEKNILIAGTGFFEDGGESLPYEIEHYKPDYSLYYDYISRQEATGKNKGKYKDYFDYSIGFTSRGCFRKCDFCVNKKYDRAVRHSKVSEFLDEDKPYIYLWDDNFLAYSGWEEILDELDETGKSFQFRQGLDLRLMTKEKAQRLSRSKYRGDFIFAFDHIEDRDIIEKKLKLWKRYSAKTTKLYVLCAYESQDEYDIKNTFERIKILMKYGCLPYIMRYEEYKDSRYSSMYIQLARWCNQPSLFKKKSFRQFCEANQAMHKNPDTLSSTYQTMIDFESRYPDIAKEYFDMRFEELNEYSTNFGYGRKYAHKNDCEICRVDQKMWLDAYHGLIDTNEVIRNYFVQEMDLQCLEYGNGNCNEVNSSEISDWFISVLLKSNVNDVIQSISEEDLVNVMPCNIPQFSNINDAVIRTLDILSVEQEAITYSELGYHLDGQDKSELAKKKYGENHSKLATLLDLVSINTVGRSSKISLSVLGTGYYKLSNSDKDKLLSLLILRIPIIQRVLIDAEKKVVTVDDYMTQLSKKTALRRSSNISELLEIVYANTQNALNHIYVNINGI